MCVSITCISTIKPVTVAHKSKDAKPDIDNASYR